MKQQSNAPSQNPTPPLKRPQPKTILPCSEQTAIGCHKNMNIFRSKKRIKRYEQILQAVAKQGEKQDAQGKNMARGELKNFIVGQLNRINIGMAPLTMKLLQKNPDERSRLRCSTQANESIDKGQNLLFTFYPKQKHSQDQSCETSASAQINQKKMEQRSFSLKNSPIVNYPVSSKILPKAFRVRTEGDSGHFKRSSQILSSNFTQIQQNVLKEKESNKIRTRNFSMKCRPPYDSTAQILQKLCQNRQQKPC